MVWHEVLAWAVIGVAFVVAAVWVVRRIVCPKPKCAACDKECLFRRDNHN